MGLASLGGAAVDLSVELEGGRSELVPGGQLRGLLHVAPRKAVDIRRVLATLTCTEEYAYEEREHDRSGSSGRTTWGHAELERQEAELAGAARIGDQPGERRTLAFALPVAPGAPPSVESDVLRLRWSLRCSLDVGGRDPHVEVPLTVPLAAGAYPPGDPAAGERFAAAEDGPPYTFWVSPAPLRVGSPFSGAVDTAEPFDLGSARLELKLTATTTVHDGIAGALLLGKVGLTSTSRRPAVWTRTLWRGVLAEGGAMGAFRRYLFSGVVPAEPVVTASLPHGATTAVLDVVVSARLRRDRHITRPVAIVTR